MVSETGRYACYMERMAFILRRSISNGGLKTIRTI
jgi:hypothetical protein